MFLPYMLKASSDTPGYDLVDLGLFHMINGVDNAMLNKWNWNARVAVRSKIRMAMIAAIVGCKRPPCLGCSRIEDSQHFGHYMFWYGSQLAVLEIIQTKVCSTCGMIYSNFTAEEDRRCSQGDEMGYVLIFKNHEFLVKTIDGNGIANTSISDK